MRLEIKGLSELRDRLARLDLQEVMARALAEQAERVAQSVRDGLSSPAGAGSHDRPWAQTGALRDSIGAVTDGLQATVGSNDPAAVPQEMGTSRLPPRPFLAPVAAGMGPEVAAAVGEAVSRALKGEPGVVQVASDTSRLSFPVPTFPWDGAARDLERWLQRPRVGPTESFTPSPGGPAILNQQESAKRPPAGSTPIDKTPWSGDHRFKDDVVATPKTKTMIAPNGDVWTQNPDETWDNEGPASNMTGSGKPSGRKGRDREKWNRDR